MGLVAMGKETVLFFYNWAKAYELNENRKWRRKLREIIKGIRPFHEGLLQADS